MIFIYLGILIGLISAIFAIYYIMNQKLKLERNLVIELAEVKMKCSTIEENHVTYLITFKFENGVEKTFKVNKKLFFNLEEHQTGRLSYQLNKLIQFDYEDYPIHQMKSEQHYFLDKTIEKPKAYVYGINKELGINIELNQRVASDINEVNNYIKAAKKCVSDHFIVILHQNKSTLEIAYSLVKEAFDIRYSYRLETMSFLKTVIFEEIDNLIQEFFRGADLRERWEFEKE
jgi:hypothetical protein